MNEVLRKLLFLPEQASTFAWEVDQLHYFVIITTMIMSTAVGLTSLLFFARYRRRSEAQTTPHVSPTVTAEVLFIGTPLVFFLLWFAMGYADYVRYVTPPPNAMDVYVMGKKWMWKFAYPEGPNSINVLRVPAGKPVRLLMTARDVIHSFYVPEFRVKMDVLPGRYTEAWFEATKPGRYQIFCTEFCGTGHSMMRGEVIVMEQAEYENWLQLQRKGDIERADGNVTPGEFVQPIGNLADQGKRIATDVGCFKCHSIDGTRHIGPTWLDMYRRREQLQNGTTIVVDEPYITESMMDPNLKVVAGFEPVMPSFAGKLAGPEVAAIVEYIKSLQSESVHTGPSGGPVYAPVRGR